MNVEIISIGDELLIGQVINTNAAWMAEQLSINGFRTIQITSISDEKSAILNALKDIRPKTDIVLITGGLGPTKDDITKQVLADFFQTELIFDEKAYRIIQSFFSERGLEVTEINKKQAEVLEKCTPIYNYSGTASGMWIKQQQKIFVSLPGVPFEMKTMMSESIIPLLKKEFQTTSIYHKTILTTGIGESFLSEIIKDWEDNLPGHIKLAYLPAPGIVRLRLSATGQEKNILKQEVEKQIQKLHQYIPDKIFGYDQSTLEGIVGNMLKKYSKTLCTAESCTGGYIGHLITSIPGSSDYYNGSIVSYSNDAKMNILNVLEKDIQTYGAVSESVIKQMAVNAKKILHADYSIATSGIAGPTGGTESKPVGTTWIAVSGKSKTITQKFLFGNHRQRNIRKTALAGLNLLRKIIIDEHENN